MAGTVRGGSGVYGRLLLLTALLFGIVTMHTVGHPAEHGGPPPSTAPAHTGPAPATGTGPASAADRTAEAPAPPAHPLAPAGPIVAADAGGPAPSGPAHGSSGAGDAFPGGMDPLSVCLAVLGAWGLALLAARLFGPRPAGRPYGAAPAALLLRVLRAVPPPRIPVLARVSVLRV